MKIITAHQSSYLPWLGFFHKIALSDVLVVLDGVQFEKNSFSNRNRVKGPQGPFWLTVPVHLKGHLSNKIKDIKINQDSTWKKDHLKSLEMNYCKAPYFDRYIGFFRSCFAKDWHNLAELIDYMLLWLLEQLDINVEIFKMSDFSFQEKKSDLVLEICRKFEADTYIFGSLGKSYAEADKFKQQGIKIHFQDYKHPEYQQLHGEFTSHLSAIDLLFNHGPKSGQILMEGNLSRKDLRRMGSVPN